MVSFSERQQQVLCLKTQGFEIKEIATKMSITVKTVEYHWNIVMKKIGVANLARITHMAMKMGLVNNIYDDVKNVWEPVLPKILPRPKPQKVKPLETVKVLRHRERTQNWLIGDDGIKEIAPTPESLQEEKERIANLVPSHTIAQPNYLIKLNETPDVN